MSYAWSPYQEAVFRHIEGEKGSLIVEAVAGSGKTTTIVECARRLKGSAYLAAFNKKMGDELEGRIKGMPWKSAGTFHKIGLKACKAWIGSLTVEARKLSMMWGEACKEKGRQEKLAWGSAVVKLVRMAKNAALGLGHENEEKAWDDLIEHYAIMDEAPDGVSEEDIKEAAQQLLQQSTLQTSCVDFEDMLYLPLKYAWRPDRFDTVFVDEAQDTNRARLLLTKAMLRPGGRVIAVGDPRQAIYGFSGAHTDAMDELGREFSGVRLPLSVSYRCAKRIVRHAQQWSEQIEAFEGACEGQVQEGNLAELVSKWKPQPQDALLCRFNRPLVRVAFGLIKQGIAARIEGRAIGEGLLALIGKWHVHTLAALSEKVEDWAQAERRRALARKQFNRIEAVEDKVQVLQVLIERAEQESGTIQGLRNLIMRMFADTENGTTKPIFTLSSVHKAKGLEWDRVFLLGRGEIMPSPYARQTWELRQERNLIYVAVTRARQELIELRGVERQGTESL